MRLIFLPDLLFSSPETIFHTKKTHLPRHSLAWSSNSSVWTQFGSRSMEDPAPKLCPDVFKRDRSETLPAPIGYRQAMAIYRMQRSISVHLGTVNVRPPSWTRLIIKINQIYMGIPTSFSDVDAKRSFWPSARSYSRKKKDKITHVGRLFGTS